MAEKAVALCAACILLAGCGATPESRLRKTLASQTTGVIALPTGVIEVSSELQLAPGAHDLEIVGSGTMLKAANGFKGRAILVAEGARAIRLRDFSVDGNREMFDRPMEMAPPENAFRVFYASNGILLDRVAGVEISHVSFTAIPAFAIVASRSTVVRIDNVQVLDSGTKKANGRNNTTGGIVLEEGTSDFEVRDSLFRRIRGNALWTHSLFTSLRLHDGVFAGNRIEQVGRDAIQVGAAFNVRVENNTGSRVGYPPELVDYETYGTPVAIDTAGNTDHAVYTHNRFEEVNGKCIDLDGFHDGSVVENTCINRGTPESYLFGHFGIVMNNTDPNMHSENVEIRGNIIDGTKFGGLFLMGSHNRVIENQFLHLDKAECNENKKFTCIYDAKEPEMLETGIYLSRGVVRKEEVQGNVIRGNTISGHKMKSRCIGAGPGVNLRQNSIGANACEDYTTEAKHPLGSKK